jgi:hypothetical protein
MSDPIKPPGGPHQPSPSGEGKSPDPAPFPKSEGGGGTTLGQLMKMMTPDEKKKFEMCLTQNLSNQIKRSSDRYIEELRRERSGE